MSKQKRAKLTVSITPEKPSLQKPLVQIEGKLTEAQLEAIAGGFNTGDAGNHNEIVVRTQEVFMPKQQREKLTATQAKPCQEQFFV